MFAEILTYTIPAILVLIATYFTMAKFFNNESDKREFEIKRANQKIAFPTRLRAYERLILFLERTSPENLIPRLLKADYSVIEFQGLLIKSIREEFEHNLSQQIYVSDEAWLMIVNVKENLVKLINVGASNTSKTDRAIELSKLILEMHGAAESTPTESALQHIKKEVKTLI